ncbi:MAG: hypothetical protein R3A44_40840 [Caldilineaceae bacterium]
MRNWLKLQNQFAHKHRSLYIALRVLREKLWLTPGVGQYMYATPEIAQLAQIIRNSDVSTLSTSADGPSILFFSFRGGWSTNVAQDLVMAQALRSRGARPYFVTCAAHLPVCDIGNRYVAPPMPCNFCASYIHRLAPQLNLPLLDLNRFVSADERATIERQVAALSVHEHPNYTVDDVPVGQLVQISVPRFLLQGAIDDSAFSQDIWKRFLISGGVVTLAVKKLLAQSKPDLLWTMNGLFFSEQILLHLAQKQHIPFINYETGFFPQTLVMARNQIANHYNLNTHWKTHQAKPLTAAQTQRLETYLHKRRFGKDAIISSVYYPKMQNSQDIIQQQLELSRDKPIVLLMTNILWDSAALDRDTIFKDLVHWLETTIQHFIDHPTHQLLVRIHPAEVGLLMRESHEPIGAVIAARFPQLPPHIKIIDATSDISSYTLMDMADYGLVYTSTTGLEMTLWGKPVVVAGDTHYSGKGFTYDPTTVQEYLAWLQNPTRLTPPTEQQIELAQRYAYLLFFRMMLPFPYLSTLTQRRIQFHFERLEALGPGQDPNLDQLCQAILNSDEPGMFLAEDQI